MKKNSKKIKLVFGDRKDEVRIHYNGGTSGGTWDDHETIGRR